jgi:4-carboxymuconolactone decarboxylase
MLAATVHGGADDPVFSETDGLLVRLVDELHDSSTVSEPLWQNLTAHWTPEQLVELVVLAGFYHCISFVTNALAIGREPFAPRFPRPPCP